MTFLKDKRKRKIFTITASVALVLVILFAVCAVYLGDYYRADLDAIQAYLQQCDQWEESGDGTIVFEAQDAAAGFIFYPGGKVEHTAYVPLMHALSERGILCVLVEMPFNLAVFDINAADGIREQYPQIETWYIGGHSLGGSMAASYLENHSDEFDGLVLLGSYSTADLSASELDVLSIYGSEDGVMNREKYDANRANLPGDFTEIILDGGCHAYFGMYGAQDGDGIPTISNAEQLELTAAHIAQMLNGNIPASNQE